MQETQVWAKLIESGLSFVLMGLFAYICYNYFSRKSKEDWDRFDKEKKELKEIIAQKDAKLEECSQQMLEMTKLAVETQVAIMSKLNEFLKEAKTRMDKLN